MEEDAARNRKVTGAACLAVMRLALNIARDHLAKISMRRKFIRAARSFDFMLKMLHTVRR